MLKWVVAACTSSRVFSNLLVKVSHTQMLTGARQVTQMCKMGQAEQYKALSISLSFYHLCMKRGSGAILPHNKKNNSTVMLMREVITTQPRWWRSLGSGGDCGQSESYPPSPGQQPLSSSPCEPSDAQSLNLPKVARNTGFM